MPNMPTDRRKATTAKARGKPTQADDAQTALTTFKQAVAAHKPGDARTARMIFCTFVADLVTGEPPVPYSARDTTDTVARALDWIATARKVMGFGRKEGWIEAMEGPVKVIFFWAYRALAHAVCEDVIKGNKRGEFYTDKVQKACESEGWPDVVSVPAFKTCLNALIKSRIPDTKSASSIIAKSEHLFELATSLSPGVLIYNHRSAFSARKLFHVKGANTGRKAILNLLNADTELRQNARAVFAAMDGRRLENHLDALGTFLMGCEEAKIGTWVRINDGPGGGAHEEDEQDEGDEEPVDSGVELGTSAEDEPAAAVAAAAALAGKKRSSPEQADSRPKKKVAA
ncbi:hypothetical protein HDU87_004802 [Geranomyces variabilis]|uniref:Uncharacterized protein n=1 Tax=Geranomyces variabilis TaxID=109894 RepID=A0AAD5TJB8_9FUNG|nr:hypothetical protein HDU87_004802 [Geranomyces variabilis]